MKKLLAGLALGLFLSKALICVGDYLYISRDNACHLKGEDIMTCNSRAHVTLYEKLVNANFNTACFFAHGDLKFIYCELHRD